MFFSRIWSDSVRIFHRCMCCVDVHCTDIALYDPDKDFQCIDGLRTIPFAHVNDDYCDCIDGSDEPGIIFAYTLSLSFPVGERGRGGGLPPQSVPGSSRGIAGQL